MERGQMIFWGSPDELCQSTAPNVREAASLPIMAELSFFLKQRGLSAGPITTDGPLVRRQLQEALTKKKGNSVHTKKKTLL